MFVLNVFFFCRIHCLFFFLPKNQTYLPGEQLDEGEELVCDLTAYVAFVEVRDFGLRKSVKNIKIKDVRKMINCLAYSNWLIVLVCVCVCIHLFVCLFVCLFVRSFVCVLIRVCLRLKSRKETHTHTHTHRREREKQHIHPHNSNIFSSDNFYSSLQSGPPCLSTLFTAILADLR